MGGLFSSKKEAAPLPPPTVTEIKTPVVNQETVDRNTSDIMRRRKGSAATVLTEGTGGQTMGTTAGSVASKSLLGM